MTTTPTYLQRMGALSPEPEQDDAGRERERMCDIKRRTPFHLQRGHRNRVFVAWGGKVLTQATPDEIAELNAYEDRKGTPPLQLPVAPHRDRLHHSVQIVTGEAS